MRQRLKIHNRRMSSERIFESMEELLETVLFYHYHDGVPISIDFCFGYTTSPGIIIEEAGRIHESIGNFWKERICGY